MLFLANSPTGRIALKIAVKSLRPFRFASGIASKAAIGTSCDAPYLGSVAMFCHATMESKTDSKLRVIEIQNPN